MNEQLGFKATDRLVIINADDFGMSTSSNKAIINMHLNAAITSSSVMMPCSAAIEAVSFCKDNDQAHVGIHLTLTCSENYRYKPVFQHHSLDSLIMEDGCFPKDLVTLETSADSSDIELELNAQIELAYSLGIKPTHLDSHDGSLLGLATGRDFLEIAFDLCERYELPFLLPRKITEQSFFTQNQKDLFIKRIESADKRGILLIDDICALPYHLEGNETYESFKAKMIHKIKQITAATTQITMHPALITDELKAITEHYEKREMEYSLFNDPDIKELFEQDDIKLISWKQIRNLQRSTKSGN
ncbi:polysaccharide deacetylase family protein [Paenibacillus psychroresistens]|nr:polysaccharide deacetylase family protein [Paenibacillus psychroresistens]